MLYVTSSLVFQCKVGIRIPQSPKFFDILFWLACSLEEHAAFYDFWKKLLQKMYVGGVFKGD